MEGLSTASNSIKENMIGDQEDDQLTYQRVSGTDKRATFRLVAETHPYPIQARRETNRDLRKWATRGSKYKYKRPPPHSEKSTFVLKELICDANEAAVAFINGHACIALLDTGSQVTSIAKSFYNKHLSNQPI